MAEARKKTKLPRVVLYPVLLVIGYGVWCGFVFARQDSLIFPRENLEFVASGGPADPRIEQVWINTADGERVEAWFQAGRDRSRENPGPAVIFFHDAEQVMDDCYGDVQNYTRYGVSVLTPEYRGYGRSGGEPGQAAILADAEAFYELLENRREVDGEAIFFHGNSLGGGVAAQLTMRKDAAALVLQSTPTSAAFRLTAHGVPGFICKHPFGALKPVRRFEGPVLVLHGSDDAVVPVSHGRALASAAGDGKLVEFDAGHEDVFGQRPDYWRTVSAFIIEHGLGEKAPKDE